MNDLTLRSGFPLPLMAISGGPGGDRPVAGGAGSYPLSGAIPEGAAFGAGRRGTPNRGPALIHHQEK